MSREFRYTLGRGLKYLIPLLFGLGLILISLLEGPSEPVADVLPIKVPFTRVAVENQLSAYDLEWKGSLVRHSKEYAGKLTVKESQGEIVYLCYELETLGDVSLLSDQPGYKDLLALQKQEREMAVQVYAAIIKALTPATGLTQKQGDQGSDRLSKCLIKEKNYQYTYKGWQFTFSSKDNVPMRTVTFTLDKIEE